MKETTIKYKTYHNDILHFTEIEKTNDKLEKIDLDYRLDNENKIYILENKINEIIENINSTK